MIVCTWNSQGYKFGGNTIANLLKDNNIEILCLQECGTLSNIPLQKTSNKFIYTGVWSGFDVTYYPWRGGRCNLAILVKRSGNIAIVNRYLRSEMFIYKDSGEEIIQDNGEHFTYYAHIIRGMLSVELQIQGGQSFFINNVHLPSGCPNFARKVGPRLFASYNMFSNPNYTVGDFNNNPQNWNFECQLFINSPQTPTHAYGGIYDYMITNIPSPISPIVIGNNYGSDHYPVCFDI